MNVFRLMLFLAGVVVCLWVRYASGPAAWSSRGAQSVAQPWGLEPSLAPLLVYDRVEHGGKLVEVNVAEAEPRYQVSTVAGEVLAQNLSSNDLQSQFPEIYAFMQTGRVALVSGPKSWGQPSSGPMAEERESH